MNWFQNMKISAKMIVSFFIVIALMVTLSVIAVMELRNVDEMNTYATEFPVNAKIEILQFQSSTRDLRRMVAMMAAYAPLNEVSAIDGLALDASEAYNASINALDNFISLLATDPTQSQQDKNTHLNVANIVKEDIRKYMEDIKSVVETYSKSGLHKEAIDAINKGNYLIEEMRGFTIDLLNIASIAAYEADKKATEIADRAVFLVIIIAESATIIAIIIAMYVSSLLAKPLKLLSDFMKKAGMTGDINLNSEDEAIIKKYARFNDEVSEAIAGSVSFLGHVTNIAGELETIANGDLTVNIAALSEKDTMGLSLQRMVESLSNMFAEIQASTMQVSTGSRQVSDGAQSLAQGSTEQAASIEELSSSISEIAKKTKDNADIAEKTSKLSASIKDSAVKGSRQMDEMITAVKEINEASHSISKIIKTIDDIAFQTNILALNAAVEAARAGQHGKGFAVVAEEVRNLASKSAEAAKDTGDMIQSSMKKAAIGSKIAEDTSASLDEIVSGINESSLLVDEIAKASEEQSNNISQINIGIDQVAQVIQQNSATAEQSAAASEEMNGQSETLQQLLAQFKLKDSNITHSNLLAGGFGD